MTKTQRVFLIIISILSAITLSYAIQVAAAYYHLTYTLPGGYKLLEISQENLMTLSKEQLVDLLSEWMKLKNEQGTTEPVFPKHVFYLILSLIIFLKLSLFYNWRLIKNTHNKQINQDK